MSSHGEFKRRYYQIPIAIRKLLNPYPKQLIDFEEISTLPSADRDRRSTFLLRFDDGTKLKARTLSSRTSLDFMVRNLPGLPHSQFPQIVDHNSQAILEEWFEGELLSQSPLADEEFQRAGRFLGQIHTAEFRGQKGMVSALCYHSWFESALFKLVNEDIVDVPLARRIYGAGSKDMPIKTRFVLVHRDFCPQNLLLCDGVLCSIDNTLLASRALAEDLARTWCRWKMTPAQWKQFISGYREYRNPEAFFNRTDFWILFSLTQSLLSHSRSKGVDAAKEQLKFLLRYLDDSEALFGDYRLPMAA